MVVDDIDGEVNGVPVPSAPLLRVPVVLLSNHTTIPCESAVVESVADPEPQTRVDDPLVGGEGAVPEEIVTVSRVVLSQPSVLLNVEA